MKRIKLQQNSEEWFEFRRGKISGSKLKDVYSRTIPSKADIVDYLERIGAEYNPRARVNDLMEMLSPEQLGELKAGNYKDGFYKLVAEKIARPITPNDYEDRLNGQPFSMMARGHILESEALDAFEKTSGLKLNRESEVWVSDDSDESIVSPDSSIGDKEAVEVKCPDSHVVIRAFYEDKYPDEYHEQVLKYFMVNEKLEKLHFVIYTDVLPSLPLQVFEIDRKDVETEVQMMKAFEKSVMKKVNQLAEELAF